MKKLIVFSLCIFLTGTAVFASGAKETVAGDDFPNKPIRCIIPWAAGGGTDIMVRALIESSEKHLGQPIIPVNRDGAAGTIAVTELAGMQADGYSIGSLAIGLFTTQPVMRQVQYKLDDFDGVIGLSHEPVMMVTHADNPWNTIPELIDHAKKSGKRIKYGFPGSGSLTHLPQAAFFALSGVNADAVSFAGGGPTMTALVGKHIDVAAGHPSEYINFEKEKILKTLGVFSPVRDTRESLKNIPTFKENGFDIDMSVWKFVVAPKGVPKERIQKLYAGFKKMMNEPKFIEFANRMYLQMNPYTGEDVMKKIESDAVFTKGVLQNLGLAK
jgi:tripartite-type tricarboxylate transporter receptor subunit TctC